MGARRPFFVRQMATGIYDKEKELTRQVTREVEQAVPNVEVLALELVGRERFRLHLGYVDTLHAVRGDETVTAGTFNTQFPGQRVDYLFTHGIPPQRLKSAWIEYDRLAKYASDHFPVGVEVVS